MNGSATVFLLLNAIALLRLPRRWAPLPLLLGTCYMTLGQEIVLGSLHFTVIRILVAVGFLRVALRGEHLAGGPNGLDWLMAAWGLWALLSSFFHDDVAATFVNHLGIVYNACGIYVLLRFFCQSLDDVIMLSRITAILLVPLSLLMLIEKTTGHNLFSMLGGVAEISEIRDGRIRAQGPFAHPILAGTAGAVCLPLMIGLRRSHRTAGNWGAAACAAMIVASTSSGPILSALSGIGALFMWRWRYRMRIVRWAAILGYVGLDVVMNAPAYYLLARIDLTGSSTGWHRAALIEAAVKHLSEWWLAGTDYTRHWMAYGVGWSPNHVDITNHYLQMGVTGGLLLAVLFIAVLAKAFSFVGIGLRRRAGMPFADRFMIWTLGAALFAHATTFVSVSYFDQTFVFLYLTLAAISAVRRVPPRIGTGTTTGARMTKGSGGRNPRDRQEKGARTQEAPSRSLCWNDPAVHSQEGELVVPGKVRGNR